MENINTNTRGTRDIKQIIYISSIIELLVLFLLLTFSRTTIASLNSTKTIAITEIVQHSSLEQAKAGIMDELQSQGYVVGKNLKVIEQNAQGNISNAVLIAKKFVSINPDAIVAISTPSAQTILNTARGSNIPVVISSVTDPVAAGIVKDLSVAVNNITGAMDFPLIKDEIELIKKILPGIKVLGVLYNTGEANSVKTVSLIKQMAEKYNIKIIESTATHSGQVAQSLNALIGKVDAVYAPSDNTVFSSMAKVVEIARKNKVPLFSSDPDSVKQGMYACIGYTQYAVGRTAGKLLVRVLQGETTLKIQSPDLAEVFVNATTAKAIDLVIPSKILNKKVNIVK